MNTKVAHLPSLYTFSKWFERERLKCEELTDDGSKVMKIHLMDFWLRWAKN